MLPDRFYEILKPFGNFKKGQILDSMKPEEKKIIKRKIVENGTIKEIKDSGIKENKMDKKTYENKGVKL